MFKIAELVVLDHEDGAPVVTARVMDRVSAGVYKVCVVGSGQLFNVKAGDMAHLGENEAVANALLNRVSWRRSLTHKGKLIDIAHPGNSVNQPPTEDDDEDETGIY
jgi:hypothetical protein